MPSPHSTPANTTQLRVALIIAATEAEGPGRRFALWLQGCPLRCRSCCNPEMLPFSGGQMLTVEQIVRHVAHAADEQQIEGITLLGGEPLAQAVGAAELACRTQRLGLSVMLFSGYTLAEIRQHGPCAAQRLLQYTDVLVDGPYRHDLPETRRRWIGSSNQQIHFLSRRYRVDDPQWRRPNTLEIRLQNSQLTVNGYPAAAASQLWKPLASAVPASQAGGRQVSPPGNATGQQQR